MTIRRLRGLPLQLLALTVVPVTGLLLAISFGSLALHQRAMRNLVGERDERAVRAAAAALTAQLNHRSAAVRGLSLRLVGTPDPQYALDEVDFLQHDFEGGFAVFGEDGRLLAATEETDSFWQTSPVQAQLAALRPSAVSQFLPILIDPESGGFVMLVAAQAEDGPLTVGAFFPDSLGREVLGNVFNAGDAAVIFLADSQGEILFQLGQPVDPATKLTQHPGVRDALRGESGTTYLAGDESEQVIAFGPVAPVNWALVIEEPWQAVTDPLLRATSLSPLILAPAIIIAAVAVWFGVRQVVQPLQSLEAQANRVAWGDFDATAEPVGGIEEIRRLQTELAHMARKVKASQQGLRGYLAAITTGQEEERRRLARELHDDTIQSLIGLNQQLQLAQLSAGSPEAAAQLAEMEKAVTTMITDVRRFIRALRPIYLEDLGLVPALATLAHDAGAEMGVPINLETTGKTRRLPPEVELSLYRIAQEGMNNVARHAQATSASMQLCFRPESMTLTITDDGRGFQVPDSPAEMTPAGHYGLLGMHERAELIGAKLVIESEPGRGTRLQVRLPFWHEGRGAA